MADRSKKTCVFQRSANTPIFATDGNNNIMAGAKTQPARDDMEGVGDTDGPNLKTKEDSDNEDRLDHLGKMDQFERLRSADSCYVSNDLDELLLECQVGADGDGTTPMTAAAETALATDSAPGMLSAADSAADTTGLAVESAADITGDAVAAVMLQPDSGLSSSTETGVSSQELESPFNDLEHDGPPDDLEHDGPPGDIQQSLTSAAILEQTSSTSDAAISDVAGEGGLHVVQDGSTNSSFEVLSQASAVDDGHQRGNRATLLANYLMDQSGVEVLSQASAVDDGHRGGNRATLLANYLLDQSGDTGLRLQESVEPRLEASDAVLVPHAGNNAAIANHIFDEAGADVATNALLDPEGCCRTESSSEDDEIEILEREDGNHANLVASERESSLNAMDLTEQQVRHLHLGANNQMPLIQIAMPFSEDFSTRIAMTEHRLENLDIRSPPSPSYLPLYDVAHSGLSLPERLSIEKSIFGKCAIARESSQPILPCIRVPRGDVANEIIRQHRYNGEFWKLRPMYQYIGEPGVDIGGVTRDVISNFYNKPGGIFSQIELTSLVPSPCPPDCLCEICSGILVQNLVNGEQVPKFLPKLTTLALFCSPNEITPGIRRQCLKLFQEDLCSDTQRKLADSCKSGLTEENRDEMEDLFHMFDSHRPLPLNNPDMFKYRLEGMVVERAFGRNAPHFIQLCRQKLFQTLGTLTARNAYEVWDSMRPTGIQVFGHLYSNKPNHKSMKHLKQFLRDNNNNEMIISKFLRNVTGSSALTERFSIHVEVAEGQLGLEFSTCAKTLTIPSHVESHEDFCMNMMENLGSNTFTTG